MFRVRFRTSYLNAVETTTRVNKFPLFWLAFAVIKSMLIEYPLPFLDHAMDPYRKLPSGKGIDSSRAGGWLSCGGDSALLVRFPVQQALDFLAEFADIAELPVYRCKPDIGNLINLSQTT